MKTRFIPTSVLAAGLLCGLGSAANAAALACSNFSQTLGDAGTNPPISATIYTPATDTSWSVVYTFRDGRTVNRSSQYNVMNSSTATQTSWTGMSLKHPYRGRGNQDYMWMQGMLKRRYADDHYLYVESLYNGASNDPIASNEIDCGPMVAPAPSYEPPVVAATPSPAPAVTPIVPAPTSSTIDKVAITFSKGGAYVAVSIGTMPATMLVDTGATGMTVSETIANWLVANGQATNGSTDHATLAGGVQKDFRGIDIGSVSVGGHVVRNVHAGVVPDGADMLLGLGVLAEVSPKFAINVATSTLDFQ